VTRYSFECADFLLKQDIKLLVVACNTVSSISLNEIRKRVSIPVVGVIDPGAHAAVKATVSKKIGVIGTEATVRSNAYRRAIKSIDETIEVFGTACPLFVPLVEEGWTEGNIARLIVERYLKEFKGSGVDTLVLGCTHYPLLKRVIAEVMGSIFLIDSAIETSKVVAEVLAFSGKLRNFSSAPLMEFFVTDSPEKFVMVGERFLNDSIVNIKRIAL
jgi:glutamate racemase